MYINNFRHKPVYYELNGKKILFYLFDYQYYEKKVKSGQPENEGLDIISKSIRDRKTWATFQTEIMIEILKGGNHYFVDVGSHIGYFSIIANLLGNKVLSIEKNSVYSDVLDKTITNNKISNINNILIKKMELNDQNQKELVITGERIRCLKVSVNGNEILVLNIFRDLMKEKKIDYVITNYAKYNSVGFIFLLKLIKGYGYNIYDIGLSNNRHLQKDTNHLDNLEKFSITNKDFKLYFKELKTRETTLLFKLKPG